MTDMRFNRLALLARKAGMDLLAEARVAVFGVGGVGSWTAEALARSGVGRIDLIDADVVAESNINRQLMALSSTVGEPKAEVLRRRLLDINHSADVRVRIERYTSANADTFDLTEYTHVVDAIDSLADKALLILRATSTPHLKFYSSMGAAQKLDPSRFVWMSSGRSRGVRLRPHSEGDSRRAATIHGANSNACFRKSSQGRVSPMPIPMFREP